LEYPFLLPPEEADEIGRLGHYRVLRLLGEGGMGLVFLAEDATLRRQVALKVMKSEPSKPQRAQRFFREAQALAQLKHEHLVPVYHAEQQGDTVFYAMELLEGESLADRLKRKEPIDTEEIVRVGREVAAGLAYIHQQGLVHRDIKPPNIWLEAIPGRVASPGRKSGEYRVKILDLGLVRAVHEDIALTQAGIVVGSVGFMSPEQARGDSIDGRSDLFSLGCVLYHLCTRAQAFDGASTIAVLTALAVSKPRPIRELNPDIPQPLAKLVMELLAKDPNDRPASADEVRQRFERLSQRAATLETAKRDGLPRPSERARKPVPPTTLRERPRRTKVTVQRPARWMIPLAAGVVACMLLGLVVWFCWPAPTSSASADLPSPVNAPAKDDKVPAPTGETTPPTGETKYLVDLPPLAKENWPSSADGEYPGKVMKKDGKPTAHGIAMGFSHDADGPVSVSYRLKKQFTSFQSEVAVTENRTPKVTESFSKKGHFLKKDSGSVKAAASCTFSVYGDGKLLWQQMATTHDTPSCAVSVSGVDVLKIVATAHASSRGVHANWLEPSLRK